MTVLMPEKFNEKFTVYLNAAGTPVQRTLREMTPSEVLAAMQWQSDEGDRLERDCAPFAELRRAVEAGEDLPDDVTFGDIRGR
jgi:hypothetical protein